MRRAAVVAAVLALAAAAGAGAAGVTVSLNLKAGYANRIVVACKIRHHYTLYHPRAAVQVAGAVAPVPTAASWQVKVKVKRCVNGRFRTVATRIVAGHKDGTFYATFRFATRGFLFARAYYYGVSPAAESDKQYLRIL
jgi:hypothetical protein